MQNYDDVTTKRPFSTHTFTQYTLNGHLHRTDGPAEVWHHPDGAIRETYYLYGQQHREEGPAEIWYYPDGSVERREYYLHGKLHREDGPAIVHIENGIVYEGSYYLDGIPMEDF